MIFTPSEQERQAQAFDPDKLAAIVASIQTQGFAVVSDLVPDELEEEPTQDEKSEPKRVVSFRVWKCKCGPIHAEKCPNSYWMRHNQLVVDRVHAAQAKVKQDKLIERAMKPLRC